MNDTDEAVGVEAGRDAVGVTPVKRGRGRPRKTPVILEATPPQTGDPVLCPVPKKETLAVVEQPGGVSSRRVVFRRRG